jgi:predicted membrane protein
MCNIKTYFYLSILLFIIAVLYILFDFDFFKWGFTLKINSIETLSTRWKEISGIVMTVFSFFKNLFMAIFDFLAPLFKELTASR